MNDFGLFLAAMRGKNLLHLGHKDADPDALGSAYALSRFLPGDVGFADGLKIPAQDLANHIGLEYIIDPEPIAYEFTIIYDTISLSMLGLPLPANYAIFDHHEPGGHRFASFHNELAEDAAWAFVKPVESTCSLLVDLFQERGMEIDHTIALALAAGIVTDTSWLRRADGPALRRLASVLDSGGLYLEDVVAVVDSPNRRSERRAVLLTAIDGMDVRIYNGWSILAATTDSIEDGFALTEALDHLGGDVRMVSFPRREESMVIAECSAAMVEQQGVDLLQLMEIVALKVGGRETWGTPALGRIVAPIPGRSLLMLCVDAFIDVYSNNPSE
jgi:nanoRNase/pAp phosphatase (c-di-AMP/oligoRNAs hydrolase)